MVRALSHVLQPWSGERVPANMAHEQENFIQGDICDQRLVNQIVGGFDAIINFAAESHVDRSITEPDIFLETNLAGVGNLLKASLIKEIKKFVQISTDEVLGSINSGSWTSQSPLLPNSPYAASKAGAELLIRAYGKTYGLD